MAHTTKTVEVTVKFKVTLNKYGEVSSVEPERLMSHYFDEAGRMVKEGVA